MATKVLMPQLGESIVEGTIVRWNKAIGESVDLDEPLLEISTDKVDAEIPSPAAGVLVAITAQEGETVEVDSIVALIEQSVEPSAPVPPAGADGSTASAPGAGTATASAAHPSDTSHAARLSPVVRQLARERGIDVSNVKGTGQGGRITKADLLAYAAAITPSSAESDRVEPMSLMRRTIAERMVTSRQTSAHVHTVFDVDFSRIAGLRASHRRSYEQHGTKLTYLSFVARAVVDAIHEVPVVNASVEGDTIVYKKDVNLGIAVALDDGLIVPVIKQAQDQSLADLSRAVSALAERARSRRLTPGDVDGGTFTITNPGTFGSVFAMPIINQPQLSILCMGAVEKRPVVIDSTIVIRHRAYLTLGFDHRVIDGAVADRFMATLKAALEGFDEAWL